MLEGELGSESMWATGSFGFSSVDVAFKAERGTQVRVDELSDVGQESKSGSVVGDSSSEVGAWMPVKTNLLGSGNWATSFSGVQGTSEGEHLVHLPHETNVPSTDSTGTDSVDSQTALSDWALVSDSEISLVLVVSSKSELGKESHGDIILLKGPVFLNIDSSVDEIEVQVKDSWNTLASELGNSPNSG